MKIYLFPFLIDLVLFLVMLRLADAAGREMKLSNLQAALFMVSYSIVYLVACLTIGRVLHRGNARRIFLASILMLMLLAVPLFFTRTFWPTLVLFSVFGIAAALAFNSFQTFMRGEAPPGSLALTIARYTISWSSGIACGVLLGGFLKDFGGPFALAAFTIFACGLILFMSLTHKAQGSEHESSDATVEDVNAEMLSSRLRGVDSRYVMIGWMLCLSANFSQRPLSTFIPKFYAENLSPPWVAGSLLFVMFISQALSGYACRKWRHLLYRPQPLVTAQLLVVLALAVLWLAPSLWISAAMLLILGLLFGFLFFACVFYVSNDARSSHNVGINEAMVGVGTILGMLVSELSMRKLGNPSAYFPACMALTLLMIALQCGWLYWSAPKNQSLYCVADSIE